MSTQTICNKCNSEIKTSITLSNNASSYVENAPFYQFNLRKYTCGGALINDKEYHLCESCGNLFNDFISEKNDISTKTYSKTENGYNICKNEKNNTSYAVGDHIMPIPNTFQVGNMLNNIKSVMIIGNIHIYTTKIFNKFQKYMWKKVFGVEIKEKEKE